MLRDVAYLIEAHFEVISGPDNEAKHLDQFCRRARNRQCYTRPYLGCREFAADFALIEDGDAIPETDPSLRGPRNLGWMLQDIEFDNELRPADSFDAMMHDGVIQVPPFAEARR